MTDWADIRPDLDAAGLRREADAALARVAGNGPYSMAQGLADSLIFGKMRAELWPTMTGAERQQWLHKVRDAQRINEAKRARRRGGGTTA